MTTMIVLFWSRTTGTCSSRSAGASRHSIGYMQRRSCHLLAARPIESLGPTLSLGPATWVELVRLAARDRTDAAIAKPEPPFVRVDELGGQFPGMPGAPSHGQNRGLAVGAADQASRACDSAHGLTGKERAISRLAAPGSRVPSEPDPTTVSRSAPFIRSEPCVCRRVRGWDLESLCCTDQLLSVLGRVA